MKEFKGYTRGMGIGGWLTNYKRLRQLPPDKLMDITIGDEEHFDAYITREDVKNIASFGMDHIRVAFDQTVMEEYSKPFRYRENGFRHIDDFVSWCGAEHINVILNLHKAIGCICDFNDKRSLLDDAELQERFIALWREFERRYHGESAVFELMNEVTSAESGKWNSLAERTIKAIRELNPSRGIMVGSAQWNSADKLKDLKLYDDENVVYTFHFYEPFEFTHQRGIMQPYNHYYNREMPYPCDTERYKDFHRLMGGTGEQYDPYGEVGREYLWDRLQPAADFVKANPGKILTCGEFGTIRHCKTEYRVNWMRDVIAFCKKYELPYTVWNYLSTPYDGNRFSLVDDDNRRIVSEDMLKAIRGE